MKLPRIAKFLAIASLFVIPNLAKAQIPADPTNLFVTEISATQIDLTWDDNSSDEIDFRIEVGDKYDFSGDNAILTVGANGTATASFSNIMLSPETAYYYRVRATNSFGQSGYSNIKVGTTITAPGNALDLDGLDDYVGLGNPSPLEILGDLTISAWVRWSGNTTATSQTIVSRTVDGDLEVENVNYWLHIETNGQLRFFYETGAGADVNVLSTSSINQNEWVHVAVTRSVTANSDVTFFINGNEDNQVTGLTNPSGGSDPGQEVWIGAKNQLLGSYFDGQLDEVRIWNTARSQSQINNNISSTLSGSESGLLAYYRFDQDDPTDLLLPDRSNGSNDGTWNGNGGGVATPQWPASEALADLHTVINTNDSGTGSFRWTLDNSNNLNEDILFDIPGGGPWTISPVTNLPAITERYQIDATTQPGWTETNLVIIQQIGTSTIGLEVSFDDVEIYGFEITGFDGANEAGIQINSIDEGQIGGAGKGNVLHGNYYGIHLAGSSSIIIRGNKIGTDNTGLVASPNEIGIEASGGHDIGGASPGDGNLVSGNNSHGIHLTADDFSIRGNFIGTDVTGTALLPNGGAGISLNVSNTEIGGMYPDERNVIVGNVGANISITGGNVSVIGNNIGVDVNGDTFTPTTPYGIEITGGSDHDIGGGGGNIIAGHTQSGVFIDGTVTGTSIQGNLIYCNFDKAITLDPGGNNDIQPPTITSITAGSVSGTAGLFDEIHVYRDGSCNRNQADEFLGTVTADDAGIWSLTGQTIVADTEWTISATATNATDGTSELTEPEIAVYLGPDNSGTELFNNQVIPVNFGHVPDGETKELSFTIENSGTKELRIIEITPGGEFTNTSAGSVTIPAGGSFLMTIELDAEPRGIINEVIDIASRDIDEEEFLLPVTGTRGFLTPTIWWTDDTTGSNDEISKSNLDGTNEDIPYYSGSSVDIRGIAMDTTNNMVFWTTTDAQILCGRIGDSSFEAVGDPIVDESDGSTHNWQALDVDGTAGKVYWCDVENGQVRRINFDGSNPEVLVSVSGPKDIALDIAAGKMYYMTSNGGAHAIRRANLNGTSPETLLSGLPFLRGLTLDLANGHIYWTDNGGIFRANLDGSGQEEIVNYSSEVEAGAIELDVTSETIYVMDYFNFAPPIPHDGGNELLAPSPDGYRISSYSYQGEFVMAYQPSQIENPQFLAIDPRVPHKGGVILKDYNALVALYNSTDGASWTDNTDWLSGSNVDTWYGTTRSDNRVAELTLETNNLAGSLPSELGDLTALEDLDLEENQLTGSIPIELGNLVLLEDLELNDNQLTGSIPAELGDLTNLIDLELSTNQLIGTIPVGIWNLTDLNYLDLDHNLLTGTISSNVGNLTQMLFLELDDNELTGSIPIELGNLILLQDLELSDNQLIGSIPVELGSLTNLEYLDLSGNMLTGSIPLQFGDLANLIELDVGHNLLGGDIPSELSGLTNAEDLTLWDNQLTGSIPVELGTLTGLLRLHLDRNLLTGSIPSSLGDLVNLETLTLWENQLTGTIPTTLGNLILLDEFQMHDNQLTGSIPTEFENLVNLDRLWLSGNQLSGTIPTGLGDLTLLSELIIDDNQLTGGVPTELAKLLNLVQLELDNNLLDDLPDLSALVNMVEMEVHNNNFHFDDLEANAGITGILYSPQANISGPGVQNLNVNDPLNLTVSAVGGSVNQYQWVKDGVDVAGETNTSLSITSVELTDAGTYYLDVTSALVPGLTLRSEDIVVVILGSNQLPELSFVFYLSENSDVGKRIGTIVATDLEMDPVSYSILSGNTSNAFSVGASSGDIDVNSTEALDFETTPIFNLIVEASDGNGGVATVTVSINLIDIADENPLGVAELSERLTIYPNPVHETLFVGLVGESSNELDIQLFTVSGSQVMIQSQIKFSKNGLLELDLKNLAPGIYLLKIQNQEELVTKNILVR